jgi:hypothetical protein
MSAKLGTHLEEIGPAVFAARTTFLGLVGGFKDTTPDSQDFGNDVPSSLRDGVLSHFTVLVCDRFNERLFAETPPNSFASDEAIYQHLKNRIRPEEVEFLLPDHEALARESSIVHKRLVRWAKGWGLDKTDWCLDFAVAVLRLWLFDHSDRRFRSWGHAILHSKWGGSAFATVSEFSRVERDSGPGFVVDFGDDGIQPFSCAGWNFRVQESGEWARAVRKKFGEHLKSISDQEESRERARVRLDSAISAHVRTGKRARREHGFVFRKQGVGHFLWLVRYQIQRWDYSAIARHYNTDAPTVYEGVNNTASVIGLSLREPSRGGRPKKIKT